MFHVSRMRMDCAIVSIVVAGRVAHPFARFWRRVGCSFPSCACNQRSNSERAALIEEAVYPWGAESGIAIRFERYRLFSFFDCK